MILSLTYGQHIHVQGCPVLTIYFVLRHDCRTRIFLSGTKTFKFCILLYFNFSLMLWSYVFWLLRNLLNASNMIWILPEKVSSFWFMYCALRIKVLIGNACVDPLSEVVGTTHYTTNINNLLFPLWFRWPAITGTIKICPLPLNEWASSQGP